MPDEGSFVLVISEGRFLGEHSAFYDLYRIEDDAIAEPWDVIETIPAAEDHRKDDGTFRQPLGRARVRGMVPGRRLSSVSRG